MKSWALRRIGYLIALVLLFACSTSFVLAQSTNLSVTVLPNSTSTPQEPTPTNGGVSTSSGGSSIASNFPATAVVIKGTASAGSKIVLLKDAQITATTFATTDGHFEMSVYGLTPGTYTFALYAQNGNTRSATQSITLYVGANATTLVTGVELIEGQTAETISILKGDLNHDGKVDLIDFSLLFVWYKKTGFPVEYDLNDDGKIDLADFSILAFNWTG